MEFFNNKRLLIVLSGVACIMIALVVFIVSILFSFLRCDIITEKFRILKLYYLMF